MSNKLRLLSYEGLIAAPLFVFLLLIIIFTFRTLFTFENSLVWGDAPYFYPQALQEFWNEPYAWTNRGEPLGGVNKALWIAPLMVIYGALHSFLGLENDLIIRLLFYWPAVLLAFVSSYWLARHLNLSPQARLITGALYILNTYFILLVDGGQVGVTLAFGVFPLAVLSLKRLLEQFSLPGFYLSLSVYLLLTIADARFVFVAGLVVLVWHTTFSFFSRKLVDWSFLGRYLVFCISIGLVGLYWILPTFMLTSGEIVSEPQLQSIRLINPLFLFQPHWSDNVFGKVNQPPFYFALFPILVFSSVMFGKSIHTRVLSIVLIVFIFLTKGASPPLGQIYDFFVTLPYGAAFRDSTKFFAPVLLFSGALIGFTYDSVVSRFVKYRFISSFIAFCFLGYLALTVFPAIRGQMNGVLQPRSVGDEYRVITSVITSNSSNFRSLWFPEKHPFGFESREYPAVDARLLVTKRPFASMNVGTDPYNFFHNNLAPDFLGLLAIKYLIFSGDFRNPYPGEEEKKGWSDLVDLVRNNPDLKATQLSTAFPILENGQVRPRVFKTDKLVAVVGGDDIYGTLKNAGLSTVSNQAFLFLEDGKFDPSDLISPPLSSVVIVLNKKNETDFKMAFLQKFFLNEDPQVQEWAHRKSSEYLKYRYELLTKGLETQEFDYGREIYFSTQAGERIVYPIKVLEDGMYILAVKYMGSGSVLELALGSSSEKVKTTKNFTWYAKHVSLKSGSHNFNIINQGGLSVVNVVALVPLDQWEEAEKKKSSLVDKFPVFDLGNQHDITSLVNTLNASQWTPLEYRQENSVRYTIVAPDSSWILFSESYDPRWMARRGEDIFRSLPGYSLLNVFYLEKGGNINISFEGQKYLRWGEYLSVLSVLSLLLFFLSRKSGVVIKKH